MATDITTSNAIDNVFNDDFSDFGDDPFADKPTITETRDDKAILSPRSSMKRKTIGDDDKENAALGLDEEVKIVKKRKPIAKLDEARLLSKPGLPVLRTLIREKRISRKLKLKGKGNEFKDAARLLNYFQLWLDNLYPRAKFADALQLVEKAGHTKRMQMMRNEWINEGKPGYIRPETVNLDVEVHQDEMPNLFGPGNNKDDDNSRNNRSQTNENDAPRNRSMLLGNGLKDDSLFVPDNSDFHPALDLQNHNEGPEDDELDALLAMQDNIQHNSITTNSNHNSSTGVTQQDDSEGEDDLDALLAEQNSRYNSREAASAIFPSGIEQQEVGELEALLAEQESRQTGSSAGPNLESYPVATAATAAVDHEDDDSEDELTAAIAAARSRHSNPNSTDQSSTASQQPQEKPDPAPEERLIIEEGEDSQLKDLEADAPSSSPVPNEK